MANTETTAAAADASGRSLSAHSRVKGSTMKAARFAIATTVLAPLTWSYGCGSTSSNPSPAPDGGDATTMFDGPSVQESGVMMDAGAEAAPSGDAGVTGIAQKVAQTNLFANTADGGAPHVDPNLVDPWGLAFNPMAGIAWISDNGLGLLTLYQTNLPAPLPRVVTVPRASAPPLLLLADFHNARVDVLDANYKRITPVVTADGGPAWSDPSVASGYAPYNIVVFDSKVYITYAKQKPPTNSQYDLGPGFGALSVFDTGGNLLASLVPTGGPLNAPWGMAVAPTGWGQLGSMLLVGNFGDGHVNAFNPTNGKQVGTLVTSSGAPLVIPGLWSLVFGVNAPDAGVATSQLYFTSGPNMEMGGLYGYLTAQ
jgi:hypothetical protein